MPFRQAHHAVGALVALAERLGKPLNQLTLAELQSVEKKFGADALKVFDLEAGPGPARAHRRAGNEGSQEATGEVEEADWLNEAARLRRSGFIRAETMAQASEELLAGLLKDVSRSFYLTLRVLPGKVRAPIGLAYLLARTTDTIADTELVALEQRLEALRALRERIQGRARKRRWILAPWRGSRASRAEGVLLEKCEASLALLRSLPPADRATCARGAQHHHQRAGTGLAPLCRRFGPVPRGAAHG